MTQGVLKDGDPEQMVKEYRDLMDSGKSTVEYVLSDFKSKYAVDWMPFLHKKWTDAADTALPMAELRRLGERITSIPSNFKLHPLVENVIANRRKMANDELPLDWGMGEHMAFASLVASGYAVRITGQDSGRRGIIYNAPTRRAARPELAKSGMSAPTSRCRTSPTSRRRSLSSTRCFRKRR